MTTQVRTGKISSMNKERRQLKDISQLRKMKMRRIMPRVSDVVQGGRLPKSIEISSPNNSNKRKLKEKQLLLPPLKAKKVEKVKREKPKKVKLKKRRRKKRKRLRLSFKEMLSQPTSLLSQSLTLKTLVVCKISLEN